MCLRAVSPSSGAALLSGGTDRVALSGIALAEIRHHEVKPAKADINGGLGECSKRSS